MKRIFALTIVALALASASVAGAKVSPTSAQDEGGGQTVHVWIEQYSFPWPPWTYYCRYASDGQVTWQVDCWT